MSNLIEFRKICLNLLGKKQIKISNLNLTAGECVFITGKNGCGKSTILKYLFSPNKMDYYATATDDSYAKLHISRVKKDNSFINEIDLLSSNKFQKSEIYLSYVYIEQEETFVSIDTVMDSILIPTKFAINETKKFFETTINYEEKAKLLALKYLKDIYRHDKKYIEAEKDFTDPSKLNEIALSILNKKKTNECSGGQKKMISLIRGFLRAEALDVDLIVLDEPLNHLDRQNKIAINQLINELKNKKKTLSFIIVSHLMLFDLIFDSTTYEFRIDDNKKDSISKEKIEFYNLFKTFDE